MPDETKGQPETVHEEQREGDFESEFGLESNPGPEEGAEAGAEAGTATEGEPGTLESEIERETRDLLDLEQTPSDNLALMEEREKQRRQREEEAAEAEGEESEGEAAEEPEAEPEEGEEPEAEAEAEDEELEELTAEETAERWNEFWDELGGLDEAQAQGLFEFLAGQHADELAISFEADGEQQTLTVGELVEQAQTGAVGGEQAEQLREVATKVQREHEQAEQLFQEAKATEERVKQLNAMLEENIDDPQKFVENVLVPQSSPEYMQALRDQLDRALHTIEQDPRGFRLEQEITGLREELSQFIQGVAGPNGRESGAEAPRGSEAATDADAATGDMPEDYGFVPNKGYPDRYLPHVNRALTRASKIAGVDPNDVVDKWDEEGRKRDVFDVLEEFHHERFAEAEKVNKARKAPPKLPTGAGGARAPKPNARAREAVSWDDIPGRLARDIEESMT